MEVSLSRFIENLKIVGRYSVFIKRFFYYIQPFSPRGQSVASSTVVIQEIKVCFTTAQLCCSFSSMRTQLLFLFMGSFY